MKLDDLLLTPKRSSLKAKRKAETKRIKTKNTFFKTDKCKTVNELNKVSQYKR